MLLAIDPRLGAAEPDPEIQELIAGSAGVNLGVDFLPGSLPYTAAGDFQPGAELAAEIVWLDALCTNVDRTARNPNMLRWHDRLWLIDHGAALYLAHGGLDPAAQAERPFPMIAEHVLLSRAGSIAEAGARLSDRVTADAVRRRGRSGAGRLVRRRRSTGCLRRLSDSPAGLGRFCGGGRPCPRRTPLISRFPSRT